METSICTVVCSPSLALTHEGSLESRDPILVTSERKPYTARAFEKINSLPYNQKCDVMPIPPYIKPIIYKTVTQKSCHRLKNALMNAISMRKHSRKG